ncbi:MAG TPA: ABC transporter substrate-binding protein [Acidimicrobiales bacterium]|nr:ABC transporter substrate-binding protein [Acidimicrobiales bacterium]
MQRFSHGRIIVAALVASSLVAAACSGDEGTSSSTSTDLGETTATSVGTEATGEPIAIGFVNSEGGAFSVPELRVGNEVATGYINERLGGVNGRPLEVTRCETDGSPEASIDCANQFVEAGVVAVVEGTDLGGDAMLPILADAGIPLVGHVQFGPARMFDPNATYFGAAALAYGAAALQFYAAEGAESVVWFLPDEPSSHAFTDAALEPASNALGLDYATVYYDAAAPNWAVLATTAVAEDPDVSGTIAATDAQCAEMVGALRDAGYQGRILAASCVGLHDALGEDAVGVDTDADHWNPGDIESAPAAKQAELEEYGAVMRAAGHEDLIGGNALISFADMINLSRIMATVTGPVDGAAVAGALDATADFDSYAGPTISCDGSVMPGNSACSTDLLFFQVQADGSVRAVTDDFVDVTALLG